MNKEFIENIEKHGERWIVTDLLIKLHAEADKAIECQDIDMAQKYAIAIAELVKALQSIKPVFEIKQWGE